MHEVLTTASYVRKRKATGSPPQGEPAKQRIWELLSTPQTVETLCRALDDDDLAGKDGHGYVKSVLTDLYEKELIELSPDA